MNESASDPRVLDPGQASAAVEILVGAFFDDPLWSWAFPDGSRRRDQQRRLWTLCVEGAARYPYVRLAAGDTAVAVWLPPGASEFSDDQARALEPMLHEMLGASAPRVVETYGQLEATRPRDVPHYYLSLLGTDPRHRGRGLGLGLLADNLRLVDLEGMPAYLEASNPANVALYRRHGFEVMTSFRAAQNGPEVVTMWREPVGARPA